MNQFVDDHNVDVSGSTIESGESYQKKENIMIKVGSLEIIRSLLTLVAMTVLSITLIALYNKMSYEVNKNVATSNVSNILVSMIAMLVCRMVVSYTSFILNVSYRGQVMTKTDYRRTMALKSSSYVFIRSISSTILLILMMAFSPKFVPFNSENCNGYSKQLCQFCRMLAFFGVILIIVYGLFFLYVIYLWAKHGTEYITQLKNDSYFFRTFYNLSIFSIGDLGQTSDLWTSDNEMIDLGCGHNVTKKYSDENSIILVKCVECQHHQNVAPKTVEENNVKTLENLNPLHMAN